MSKILGGILLIGGLGLAGYGISQVLKPKGNGNGTDDPPPDVDTSGQKNYLIEEITRIGREQNRTYYIEYLEARTIPELKVLLATYN